MVSVTPGWYQQRPTGEPELPLLPSSNRAPTRIHIDTFTLTHILTPGVDEILMENLDSPVAVISAADFIETLSEEVY